MMGRQANVPCTLVRFSNLGIFLLDGVRGSNGPREGDPKGLSVPSAGLSYLSARLGSALGSQGPRLALSGSAVLKRRGRVRRDQGERRQGRTCPGDTGCTEHSRWGPGEAEGLILVGGWVINLANGPATRANRAPATNSHAG